MKILYFVTEDRAFCSHRLDLARKAQKEGHEIHVACRVLNDRKTIEGHGFTVHPLHNVHRAGINPFKEFLLLKELWDLYKALRPDIVHHIALKPVLLGTLIGRLLGKPLIVNTLGGLGYLFTRKTGLTKVLKPLILMAYRLLMRGPKVLLVLQNEDDLRIFRDKAGISPNNLRLIRGSGVDHKAFSPAKKAPPPSPTIISCVSRLLWDKGIGELVGAMDLLHKRGVSAVLWLCGTADKGNPSFIDQNILDAWGKKEYIVLKGETTDIASIYHNSHIAVLPSYREGMPRSLLEAAACAKPLVATDVPGCRDLVTPGVNGILIPKGAVQQLANALQTLISDKEQQEIYGKNARLLIEKELNNDIINGEYMELYRCYSR